MSGLRKTALAALLICVLLTCAARPASASGDVKTQSALLSITSAPIFTATHLANGKPLPLYIGLASLSTAGLIALSKNKRVTQEERKRQREAFVRVNAARITEQMAQGGGEYLTVLGRMLGCSAGAREEFGRMTQERFPILLPAAEIDAASLLEELRRAITNSPTLAEACVSGAGRGRADHS